MPQLPYETITLRVLLAHDLDRTVATLSGRAYDAHTAAGREFQVHGNLHDAKTTRHWMARGGPRSPAPGAAQRTRPRRPDRGRRLPDQGIAGAGFAAAHA